MRMIRHFSRWDKIFNHLDLARQTLFVQPNYHQRDYPARYVQENALSAVEKKHSAGLMRVNHAGEVCAQALYQGQAMTARSLELREKMQQAADEEFDHLAWCNQRLSELQSRPSYFNIFWYLGALTIGIVAGCIGDRWNLGFLAETEEQVVRHLESHVESLPQQDILSRTIVEQMKKDEAQHRDLARENGAIELPGFIKILMRLSSTCMTRIAYYY